MVNTSLSKVQQQKLKKPRSMAPGQQYCHHCHLAYSASAPGTSTLGTDSVNATVQGLIGNIQGKPLQALSGAGINASLLSVHDFVGVAAAHHIRSSHHAFNVVPPSHSIIIRRTVQVHSFLTTRSYDAPDISAIIRLMI